MNKDARKRLGQILLIVGRIALASIFIIAGYAKVKPLPGMAWSLASIKTSLLMFAIQVDSYQMLPPWTANALGHLLPLFELFLGLWLLTGIALRYSSLIATLAFCGFMAAIASAYHRGLAIDCGCGIGPLEQVGPAALIRDGLKFLPLALAVTIGAFWIHRKPRAASLPEATPSTQHAE